MRQSAEPSLPQIYINADDLQRERALDDRSAQQLAETLRRFWAFYVLTSLPWDSLRGIGNVVCIALLGGPVLKELRRFQQRFHFETVEK